MASTDGSFAVLRKRVLGLVLGLIAATPAFGQTGHAQTAWQGELRVMEQAGPACGAVRVLPRIAVHGVGDPSGPLFLWGRMQPMHLIPGPDDSGERALRKRPDSASQGRVVLKRGDGGALAGIWQEDPSASGCSFVQATLALRPVTADPERQLVLRLETYLRELQAAHGGLLAAAEAGNKSPLAALRALVDLAERIPPRSDVDASVAYLFIDAANVVHGMRQRELARRLAQAANTIYRRSAADYPEFAALSLSLEARMAYRAGGMTAAEPLLAEALTILQQNALGVSAAASSVLGQRGAWQLRTGDVRGALDSFAQALRVDEDRGAQAAEMAAAASNLAAALRESGEPAAALSLFQRALSLAESTPETPASLVEAIRDHISALQSPAGARRTSMG